MYTLQFPDRNISPKAYEARKPDELMVATTGSDWDPSIWSTIQGEGPFAGRRAIFIRLAGCNRGAKWHMGCSFCDADFRYSRGVILNFADIYLHMLKIQDNYAGRAVRELVVITGGEPMIQNNLAAFCTFLTNHDYDVQIESNGDLLAGGFERVDATLVVSPKIVPSTQQYRQLNPEVGDRLDYLKYVVDARPISPYHMIPEMEVIKKRPGFVNSRIFVQPLALYKKPVPEGEVASAWNREVFDQEGTASNYRYAAELSKRYGYRVSVQSHLFLAVA